MNQYKKKSTKTKYLWKPMYIIWKLNSIFLSDFFFFTIGSMTLNCSEPFYRNENKTKLNKHKTGDDTFNALWNEYIVPTITKTKELHHVDNKHRRIRIGCERRKREREREKCRGIWCLVYDNFNRTESTRNQAMKLSYPKKKPPRFC